MAAQTGRRIAGLRLEWERIVEECHLVALRRGVILDHEVYLLHNVVHLHVRTPPHHKSGEEHDITEFVNVQVSSILLRVLHFVVSKDLIELGLQCL